MQTDEKGSSAHSKPMMLCDPLITPQPFHRKVKNAVRDYLEEHGYYDDYYSGVDVGGGARAYKFTAWEKM